MLSARLSPLLIAVITATFGASASAAVVCEFEPTLSHDDCRSCFKADGEGIGLYLNGVLRASSTFPNLVPTQSVDGKYYSRGLEKKVVSLLTGGVSVYEFCYEKAAPLIATSVSFTLTESDFGEFDLVRSLPGLLAGNGIELAGHVDGGEASIFGSSLVFMPAHDWQGRASIPYRLINTDGSRTAPGLISIYEAGSKPTPGQAGLDSGRTQRKQQVAAAERESQENGRLNAELARLRESLQTEVTFAEDSRSRIDELVHQIAVANETLAGKVQEIDGFELQVKKADASAVAIEHLLAEGALNVDGMARSPQLGVFAFGRLVLDRLPRRLVGSIEAGRAPTSPGRKVNSMLLVWCNRLTLGERIEWLHAAARTAQVYRKRKKKNRMKAHQAAKTSHRERAYSQKQKPVA